VTLFRKITIGIVLFLGIITSGTCIAVRVMGSKRPTGVSGSEADALARRIQAAVETEAWAKTRAVQWTFRQRHSHLWDRRRMLDRIVKGDETILIDLTTRRGTVTQKGRALAGAELDARLQYGWAAWANDSFWLNPIDKMFDEGVSREAVALEDEPGRTGLMVSYSKGGMTPGDAYLWIVDSNAVPVAWRMWVQVFPVAGIRVSWEDWITLSTGAKVATRHELPAVSVNITDVAGAETLEGLTGGNDPFTPLFAH